MNTTAYIIINLLLFSSWYVFLYRKKELISFIDRIIGTFVLGLTQIIASEMLLGIFFRKLYAAPLFLLNSSISLGILIYAVLTDKRQAANFDKNDIKPFCIRCIINEIQDEVARFFKVIKKDWILLSIFSLFFISVCWIIFLGYLFPSYTWDALWYHLPIIGYIMQSGAIQENSTPSFINEFINIFPKNIELFFLWNNIFLNSDVISDLSQLLFTIIGVFTIYSIAIKLNVKEKYAIYSSLLFFFTPVMVLQSTTNYVDVAISMLFLIALNFLMCDIQLDFSNSATDLPHLKQRKFLILLAGLTTGILLGSKGSGPLFAVILSVVIVIQELIKHFKPLRVASFNRRHVLMKSFKQYLIYFIVPVLFTGSYWYIKNWVIYDNPVYPMEISIFNFTIFKGKFEGIIEAAPEIINRLSFLTRPLYVWTENIKYYLYDSRLGGFGPIWFILFLPSIVFSIIYALVKKKYDFLTISIILSIAFLLYPRNWNPRYVIFIVGLGAVSYGLALDYFKKREKALSIIALSLAAYTFLTANSPCIMPSQIKKFIYLTANERTVARHAPFNIDLHARQEYGYWIWISNNISKGDTLAYTFEPLFLSPLWNSSFSSRIAYAKSDSYNEWLKKLKENNATYILIRQNSEEDKWISMEEQLRYTLGWLGELEEKFKVVYSDENYKIVRFNKGKGSGLKEEG